MSNLQKKAEVGVTPISLLDCRGSFSELTNKEKHYAHHLSQACWAIIMVTLEQTSTESPEIFELILRLFGSVEDIQTLYKQSGISKEEWDLLLYYFSVFLHNSGNYRGFGDAKIVPKVGPEVLEKLIAVSPKKEVLTPIFERIQKPMFSINEKDQSLGFPYQNVSSYYSPDITKEDIDVSEKFMKEQNMLPLTSRLWKVDQKHLEYRFASIEKKDKVTHQYKGYTLDFVYGEFSEHLKRVNKHLTNAIPYASNETQQKMLEAYIEHFKTGDIDTFHKSQRLWVKDKNPNVEFNLGFIETYRDYVGVRAEAEGWVAINIKSQSKMFGKLVSSAEEILPQLPWGSKFNKPFVIPDFISIDVLGFGGSGVPLGINIPNIPFNDEGFKNLNLQNSLLARFPKEDIPYLVEEDMKVIKKHFIKAYQIQVGYHELLGHGSGILLKEEDEKKNFDENLINPLTNKKVESWYKKGESYDNVFGSFASSMEECRAEAVGLYLSALEDGKYNKIFGVEDEDMEDTIYSNWLILLRGSVLGMMYYFPKDKMWKQAHCRARFVILHELMKVGVVEVIMNTEENDFIVKLNRDLIKTKGYQCMSEILLKMGIYKATANVELAKKWFDENSIVNEKMTKIRQIVIDKKKPRKVMLQLNTFEKDDQIIIKDYEENGEGMIKSFVERFPDLYN
ncbi:dipeptidyl peptidase 3 [Anaeramoeba flamelloides]|uniref:Dipeptidyl peptidase 3 n=1 Tax=Anaeramoeba flamelloides TaxID=1746091 RepID=A0ABQ8XPM9_9EUKA|nr:dipeptidyl peptidase 3 [Anaeramoeba flamelloides]